MQIVSDCALAYRLATQSVPFFFTTLPVSRNATTAQHVLGRRYRGLFDESDGSFVTLNATKSDQTVIDRDCYGGIPLFYSATKLIVSTNLQLFANMRGSEFDYQAIAEYL